MLRLLLAWSFVVAPVVAQDAVAQDAAPPPASPSGKERVLIAVGALGGGVLVGLAVPPAAPFGVAAGAYATGQALGVDAALADVALVSLVATGVGIAAVVGTLVVLEGLGSDELAAALTAGGVGLVTMAGVVGARYPLRPAALAAPGRAPAPGLALHLSF